MYFFSFFKSKKIADFKKIRVQKNKKLFTLLKSPHVNKKSRDQMFFTQYIGVYHLHFFKNPIFGQGLKIFTNQKNITYESYIKYYV